eukprot:UN06539
MWNNGRHLQLYHTVPCMGAIILPLNIRLHSNKIGYIIQNAKLKLIFVDECLIDTIAKVPARFMKSVQHIIVCGKNEGPCSKNIITTPRTFDFEYFISLYGKNQTFQWPNIHENQGCMLCYTSGTTGDPKGVLLSHRSTYLHTMTVMGTDVLRMSVKDTFLPVVPMFHVSCWGYPFLALTLGSKILLTNEWGDTKSVLRFMCDHKATLTAGVPTVWENVRLLTMKNPSLYKERLRSWKKLHVGGTALPAVLIRFFKDQYGVDSFHGYGMTETNPHVALSHLNQKRKHEFFPPKERVKILNFQGLLLPGLEWKLVDPENANIEKEQDGKTTGELLLRGPWICGEYFGVSKETNAKKFHEGWLKTGDICSITEEGYMKVSDRSKDLIKSGGEWISSANLENEIKSIGGVLQAAVVGVKHPKWEERPIVILVA